MMTLENNWTRPDSGYRKFIASVLTHALSRELARKNFEAVNDSNIDLHHPESDTADVMVYDVNTNYSPSLMIELCNQSNEEDTIRTVEVIRNFFNVREAFVYNIETEKWLNLSPLKNTLTSFSEQFKLELGQLLSKYLHRYI